MEHIVYSEIWTDPTPDENADVLRLSIPASYITMGSRPYQRSSFLVQLSCIGTVQFDYFGFIKGKAIYQAIDPSHFGCDNPRLPLVKLVAEPMLANSAAPHLYRAKEPPVPNKK